MSSLVKYQEAVKEIPNKLHHDFALSFIGCMSVNNDFEDKGWDYALEQAKRLTLEREA